MASVSKKSVKDAMISLNTYKQEFDIVIEIYVGLVKQYNAIYKKFAQNGFETCENTGYSDNMKKSPIVATLENLRKDILNYATHLGLTPHGLKRINDEMNKKISKNNLDLVLEEFNLDG